MRAIGGIEVTVDKATLMAKLKENRANHAKIVAESRVGYVEKAKLALAKRMDQLAEGRIVALHFDLRVPSDHTKEYDTVIGMLEMDTGTTITLDSGQYRTLVEDEWDWLGDFLVSNASYSQTGAGMARAKGLV